jgi:SAP domain
LNLVRVDPSDRRAWDPFAPHPRSTERPSSTEQHRSSVERQPSGTPLPAAVPTIPAKHRLDAMRKSDLVALAEAHGLDTAGTRPDLIARLREAKQ